MSKVKLADVVERSVGGGTPARDVASFWNGPIPWATVKDFKDGVRHLSAVQESITKLGLNSSASNLIPAGTPIICMRMGVGRVATAPMPIAINQDLRALFVGAAYDADFVVWSLDGIRSQIENEAIGSTVKGISVDRLLSFEILDTTLPEQSKVADVLSTVDRAIAQTEALIAKQQRIKTGLMQDLLTRGIDEHGQLRSEATHAFKDSPLGRIPVEWEVKSLGAALDEAKGYLQTGPFGSQLHAYEYTHSGVPVVMPQDILQGSVSTANVARVPETRAHDLRRHRVMENDIVFARRGDLSRAAAIGTREFGWLCGTGCFLLRVPLRNMAAKWLAHLYRYHWIQRQIETNAVGSTMPSLNNGVMARLVVPIPSVDEQHKIACRIDSMDRELELLEQQLDKQQSLKTALMQDLLTGKVRVTPLLQPSKEAIA
ncbi:MAG: restriction endonuclease subunit S [Thermomonas sp.]|uniref:restriction endonuclease subunit S n=1 Tax=Thermomonas sp. TaxID=1971895 RepID=UPI001ECAF672|nr:restriction endonuclease subunit S [Thermomonas sp.]MBV2210220.1 restriction endonuclease subunit S [Thermomonas sp.]